MLVKSQFLEKLQTRQPAPASSVSKSQVDIAAFRLRMAQLQEQLDEWLEAPVEEQFRQWKWLPEGSLLRQQQIRQAEQHLRAQISTLAQEKQRG